MADDESHKAREEAIARFRDRPRQDASVTAKSFATGGLSPWGRFVKALRNYAAFRGRARRK